VLFWFNPRPALRETLIVLIGLVGGLSTLGLMLASDSPLRDQLATSTIAIMLFITVVQRARFPYAVTGCLILMAANATALGLLPDYDRARLLSDIGALVGSAGLMLVATWLLEREARQAYLLRFKERLLNTAL